MAEPPVPRPLDPVPVRQAVVERPTCTLTAPWVRWLEEVRAVQAGMQAEIDDLRARVAALEAVP